MNDTATGCVYTLASNVCITRKTQAFRNIYGKRIAELIERNHSSRLAVIKAIQSKQHVWPPA